MTEETQRRRLQAVVCGRVQGVGFRYFTLECARRLGVTGFVRNLPFGEVEVVAEGSPAALEQLKRDLEQGPPGAAVREVRADFGDAREEFHRFEIRR